MGRKVVVVPPHRFSVDFHAFHVESLDSNVVETKRNARTKAAGEQVDVAIFGDHVLRIEPQWAVRGGSESLLHSFSFFASLLTGVRFYFRVATRSF